MPRGPKGEKRPADVIGNAVHVMRIATGEVEDNPAPEHARKGGLAGGKARAKSLSPERRRQIAKKGAGLPLEKGIMTPLSPGALLAS
jgi:hypothetical protein